MQGSVDRLVKACSYIERRAESAELEPWDYERHHAAEEEQHKWKWDQRKERRALEVPCWSRRQWMALYERGVRMGREARIRSEEALHAAQVVAEAGN